MALVALFAVSGATAWAATYTYLNGNLYNSKASGAWTNHREHWVAQHGGLTNRRVQTGHQTTAGSHVAIVRGWDNAALGYARFPFCPHPSFAQVTRDATSRPLTSGRR